MNPRKSSERIADGVAASGRLPESMPVPTGEDVRAIGEIIRDTRNLSAEQVEAILKHQRANGVRFGEAAIALGLATPDDVLHALAKQFNYTFVRADQSFSDELVTLNQPFSQQSEVFRAIRAQISMRLRGEDAPRTRRAIAVVSPDSGDGKTYFAANLAISYAQLGARTLLVDADMRGPRVHELLGVNGESGLSSLLAGRQGDAVIKTVKGVPNLFVLPVGAAPPNPTELVEGPAFAVLIQELLSRFEHVIVDTSAATFGVDCTVIASRCGVALVLARKDATNMGDLQQLTQSLAAGHAVVAGVVMNER